MKNIVDILSAKNILLKSLEEIDLKLLNSRKKIQIFSGTTQTRYFTVLFLIRQKSRFVRKNADEIMELEKKLETFKNHAYKNKFLIISSPVCSRAKSFLRENRWKIIEFTE